MMVEEETASRATRRILLRGMAASALLALPACAGIQHYTLVQTVRRLLELSAKNAFAKLVAPDGFWDSEVARLHLPEMLGQRGNLLENLLTSGLLKDKVQHAFNRIAEKAARRAAPIVADAVEKIGIANAKAILEGGPTAATSYLRGAMAGALIDAMVPELGEAIRLSQDPLVAQALAALTGVDVSGFIHQLAVDIDDAI